MPKEKNKICPLLMISVKEKGPFTAKDQVAAGCLKDDCAWYYAYHYPQIKMVDKGCAIRLLPHVLNIISKK
jgi:hypothetical protein